MKTKYTDAALLKNENDSCYVPIREVVLCGKHENEDKCKVLYEGEFYDVDCNKLYEKKDKS